MSVLVESRPVRVLIVDDTADLRELLRMALERADFDVVAEAGDGREAIERARELHPDVILLDMAMPVMDGMEALPLLRQECPEARIAVLSGFDATHLAAKAAAAGADGYLQKGTSMRTVIDFVNDLVGPAEC